LWRTTDTTPVTRADIDDFAFYAMVGILLGGRLGYILFYTIPYEPHKLANDPMFILRMWEGGMSFHGGLIGATIAVLYTCYKRKLKLLNLGDVACAAAPLGLMFGRLANFINGELYGRETTAPWGMRFPAYDWSTRTWGSVENVPLVHPSQLYEAALEGALLFAVLAVLIWRFKALAKPGLVSGVFLVGYAICRTFVENFREPDNFTQGIMPSWFTMGMLLSVPMLVGGAWLIWRTVRPREMTPPASPA
jgi:phosphatidylglycerol:prolipoprotein diacylglycerol transferase